MDTYTSDKERYLEIFQSKGLPAALTALHHDMQVMEEECFDDHQGYSDEKWDRMKKYRDLSLELWELKYAQEKK